MTKGGQRLTVTFTALVALALTTAGADAAQCGSSAAGFEVWKRQMADEARTKGVSASTVGALMATHYASATIAADRGQRSFGLSLDQFLAKRGASAIVARGRALKHSQAALFASIQQRYGVPPGAIPVSLTRHLLKPEGEGAIYLCQHAVRSKGTLRNGAAEVAGGFVAWERAGLPIVRTS